MIGFVDFDCRRFEYDTKNTKGTDTKRESCDQTEEPTEGCLSLRQTEGLPTESSN